LDLLENVNVDVSVDNEGPSCFESHLAPESGARTKFALAEVCAL